MYTYTANDDVKLTRFDKHAIHPGTMLTVDGVHHVERIIETAIEPFTTTPAITTAEATGTHVELKCSGTVGLVQMGKEDWWLFFTVPFYAYKIQWQWAYATIYTWFWPFIGALVTWGCTLPTEK